jgi:hypothetical protein
VLNVLSNVPFVIVGLWGWCLIGWKSPKTPRTDSVYLAFFTGVLFTGIGSAYYHWSPDDASLVWDRLPMTVGFMSFTAMIIVERCNETVGLRLFPYLLTVGVLSVGYWTWQGDLRPYLLVQFGPMLFLPIIIWRFKGPGTRWLWATVVFYLLAKTLELFDQEIFMVTGSLVSGHALKHIAAAAGASMIIAKARVAPSF